MSLRPELHSKVLYHKKAKTKTHPPKNTHPNKQESKAILLTAKSSTLSFHLLCNNKEGIELFVTE